MTLTDSNRGFNIPAFDTDEEVINGTRRRIDELEERWKRSAAVLENVRKRLTRDFERQRTLDREAVLRGFLPVADNLERAMKADGESKNPWYEGLKAIHNQMVEALKAYEVTAFDPTLHEATAVRTGKGFSLTGSSPTCSSPGTRSARGSSAAYSAPRKSRS
jgi:molecular chaperone GrpE